MRSRILVAILLILTALFCWALGWIAWGFARVGGAIGWGLSLAVVLLLALAVWATWREVLFGLAAGRLGQKYRAAPSAQRAAAGASPTAAVTAPDSAAAAESGAGGRSSAAQERRSAARAEFEEARTVLQTGGEGDWRAWYRLGLAYDSLRDRRAAREAIGRAIRLEKSGSSGS